MSQVAGLLEATGWASQRLRNLRELLGRPDVDQHRLTLICSRLMEAYYDYDHWTDRQWGPIIDALSEDIKADELAPQLVTSMNADSPEAFQQSRLRLRPQLQSELLRQNIP